MQPDPPLAIPPEVMELERVRLRRSRLSDAEALFEYFSDPEVVRLMDYPVTTDIDALLARLSGHDERWRSGDYSWVLTLPGEDRAIGTVACSVAGHAAEFGYIINRRYWGRGLATEAARGIVSWVFSVPSLWRLSATCDVENIASARVLEKCGLTLEGTLRRAVIRPNISPEPRDALLYSKERESSAREA